MSGVEPRTIVNVNNLVKKYGKTTILDRLNMKVMAREKVSLIGPSGSGKSTLLRTLMTLERPNSGEIFIDGERLWTMKKGDKVVPADIKYIRKVRGKLGMVFQHFNLFPHMTVLGNVIEAPVHVQKVPKEEARQKAVRLLEMVGLEEHLHSYPARLSGGQKQRVAIARALAMEPDIMLFDEVTSALDPKLTSEVLDVIRKLAKETNMTILLVTHEMDFAREISDRVCFFSGGQILEEGPPSQIFDHPQHPETKEFVQSGI